MCMQLKILENYFRLNQWYFKNKMLFIKFILKYLLIFQRSVKWIKEDIRVRYTRAMTTLTISRSTKPRLVRNLLYDMQGLSFNQLVKFKLLKIQYFVGVKLVFRSN